MITCERCEELINARLDGYLTEEDGPLLEAHLARCPDCQKLDRDLTSLHQRLRGLSFDPPQELMASVMARLETGTIQPNRKKRPWAAAVCAAVLVLLAVAITPQFLPFGGSAESAAEGDAAEAPESMVMDTEPAEGGETAGATLEESQSAAEEEKTKTEPLTQEEALALLEDHLAQRGLSLDLTPETPPEEGDLWLFRAADPHTGEVFRFSVSCTNGFVTETTLP